jgi:hypothetical protein
MDPLLFSAYHLILWLLSASFYRCLFTAESHANWATRFCTFATGAKVVIDWGTDWGKIHYQMIIQQFTFLLVRYILSLFRYLPKIPGNRVTKGIIIHKFVFKCSPLKETNQHYVFLKVHRSKGDCSHHIFLVSSLRRNSLRRHGKDLPSLLFGLSKSLWVSVSRIHFIYSHYSELSLQHSKGAGVLSQSLGSPSVT